MESTCALEYVNRLCADLAEVVRSAALTSDGRPTPIATTLIMPLGVIVNELVTNAAKHGATRIAVDIEPVGRGVSVSVSDNGPGLPPGFDPAKQSGLGMRVIRGLVRQHKGTLDFGPAAPTGGARFTATLG